LDSILHYFWSIYIIKTDKYGTVEWDTAISPLHSDSLLVGDAIAEDIIEVDDGYIVAGERSDRSNLTYPMDERGWDKCWYGKIAKDGSHLMWEHYIGGDALDFAHFNGITKTNDGGFGLCGECNFSNNTKNVGIVFKADANGDSIWSTIIQHPLDAVHYTEQVELHSIHEIDGGFLVTGFRIPDWPSNGIRPFPYVFTIDSNGCWQQCWPTGINETETGNAAVLVYPNPFTKILSIALTSDHPGPANFTITNTIGQTIYHESESNFATGYTKLLDLSYLPNGLYFVDVSCREQRQVVKVVKQ
jgi:hypothetical protein